MISVKPRLLVIDDDAQVRRAYARVLGRHFQVEVEADVDSATRRMAEEEEEEFDAILCDIHLGSGASGQSFFEAVPPEVRARIVMCSGTTPGPGDAFVASLEDRFVSKTGAISALVELLLRVSATSRRSAPSAPATRKG